ncbi:hypothetical protein [Sediminibacterium sp.]|uniref:hypothetical protein n=1 Tax=Sediminibacterium sp. TaxID=1917865 RepID=UPI0025CEE943|nr:hypothetical protein [Sediminibacterium sp.]MBW0179228.1 hypothetical protein [Sediminibacterium sp.]
MKIRPIPQSLTGILRTACLGFVTLLVLQSCSKKINFQTSAEVPAARGYVKVSKDDNKNYVIKLELSNLAEVNRLDPPKESYVVWMESANNPVKNIGRINSSGSLLSRRLTVSFETISSVKPSLIFITAENEPTTSYPSGKRMMTTSSF